MSLSAIATARAAVAALEPNLLATSTAQQLRFTKKDVAEILDALEVDMEAAMEGSFTAPVDGPTYCRACGVGMRAAGGSKPKCEECLEMEAMENE